MAFLDFMKNRQAEPQKPTQEQKPEQPKPHTAREMYTQMDTQEKANQKPLTPEIKAQADRVMETLDKASSHLQTQTAPASPSEAGSHSEPTRQNAVAQNKTAPALSPTTEHVGKVAEQGQSALEKDSRSSAIHNRATPDEIVAGERAPRSTPEPAGQTKEAPQNQQSKTQSRSHDRGGWER